MNRTRWRSRDSSTRRSAVENRGRTATTQAPFQAFPGRHPQHDERVANIFRIRLGMILHHGEHILPELAGPADTRRVAGAVAPILKACCATDSHDLEKLHNGSVDDQPVFPPGRSGVIFRLPGRSQRREQPSPKGLQPVGHPARQLSKHDVATPGRLSSQGGATRIKRPVTARSGALFRLVFRIGGKIIKLNHERTSGT